MSDTQPVSSDTQLAVTLSVMQWRVVLDMLANGPYRQVAPLMAVIEQQCQTQIQRSQQMQMRGNGANESIDAQCPA